jgi:phage shock protein PspC (stress-responsive transcriptional regulator)
MGPVESPEGDSEATTATAAGAASSDAKPQADGRPGPKRLYRIRDGAMFMGVCNGIAAYLNIDVTFVRIAFVIGVVVTFGWGWLGYWILGFVIPEARTADEHAAAHGKAPFNAQDVIDDARRAAETFKSQAASTSREFRRQAREQHRQWREQARAWRRASRTASRSAAAMWGGPFLPLFSFVSFVGFAALVLAVISLVSTGTLWGWPMPSHVPVWVGVVVLFAFFHMLTIPLRAARRAHKHGWDWGSAGLAAWDSLVGMVVFAFAVWMFFRHLPPTDNFREFVQNVPEALSGAAHEIAGWIRAFVGR